MCRDVLGRSGSGQLAGLGLGLARLGCANASIVVPVLADVVDSICCSQSGNM